MVELPTLPRRLICLLFFLVTLATRIPFTSKYLYHMDSVNFALALESYNLSIHQPHPPGYFLYVMLGRLLHLFIVDPNTSYVIISVIFSASTAAVVYLVAEEIYGRSAGILAGCFALSSPNLWFHGEIALSYGAEAFFSALIGLLCWRVFTGRHGCIWGAAICLGIAGGFRQNTIVFLLPLFLLSARKVPPAKVAAALLLSGAVSLAWFFPMIWMTGGWQTYTGALWELWEFSTGHNTVLDRGMQAFAVYSQSVYNFTVYSMGTGIVAAGLALYIHLRRRRREGADLPRLLFFASWSLPAMIFYLLVFIHPRNPGYALIYTPPLLILSARATMYIGEEIRGATRRDLTAVLALILLLGNALSFLYLKSPVSWPTIRAHDSEVVTITRELRKLDPSVTAILVKSYVFHGFRQIMYYLPEYLVYQAEVKVTPTGRRNFFGGLDRRTFLSKEVVIPASTRSIATILDKEDLRDAPLRSLRFRRITEDVAVASGPVESMREIYPAIRFAYQGAPR